MTRRRPNPIPILALCGATLAGCASTGEHARRAEPESRHPYAYANMTEVSHEPRTNHGFAPIDDASFEELKASLLFTEADVRALRASRDVLEPNVGELLEVWYGFVGSNDHLIRYFSHPETGEPDARYLERVRERFERWVLDTAEADFDRAWLEKQLEIGLRHHRLKKNETDGVEAAEHIPFRHLVALHYPITTTLKPFLERGEQSDEQTRRMYEAWRKAVLMSAILWSQPYVTPADF